jgi:hypothetical protein
MGLRASIVTALQTERINELVQDVAGKKLIERLYEEIRLWENSEGYNGVELSLSLDAVCAEIETKWKAKTNTNIRLGSFEGYEIDDHQDTTQEIRTIGSSVLYWYFDSGEIYQIQPAAKALKTKFEIFSTMIVC